MRKKLILLFLACGIASTKVSAEPSTKHLRDLNTRHPYALLGDDFGILNDEDLAINQCNTTPEPFSTNSNAYPYWQCFDTREARLICEDAGYHKDEGGETALLVIKIPGSPRKSEYLARRMMPLMSCARFRNDWIRLIKNEKHVCVSGEFIDYDKDDAGRDTAYWIYGSFKTWKGCISYFEGECSLKYKLKHGCFLNQ